MRVAGLHVYPVKSTRGVDLTSAVVEPWGLAGDRRWMVVDDEGRLVTAREEPRLLSVAARVIGEGELTVTGPPCGRAVGQRCLRRTRASAGVERRRPGPARER